MLFKKLFRKKIILHTLICLLFTSCNTKVKEEKNFEEVMQIYLNDSSLVHFMINHIDTLNEHVIFTATKEEALEFGIPEIVYEDFIKSMHEVNRFNDSLKVTVPDYKFHFNFPDQ